MFWKFNSIETSAIETILLKEDVTLRELMEEDDVLQECKGQNNKLIDFLVKPESMEEMVNLVTQEPNEEFKETMKYKYPNIACELLTSDVSRITDCLSEDENLVNKLYSFIEMDKPLNPLLASFFSKVMGLLIARKSEMIFEYLRAKKDFIGSLLYHMGTSAIMDLFLRLITCIDSPQTRLNMIVWLNEQRIVQKLVAKIVTTEDEDTNTNASQSLCDVIRFSRDQQSQLQEQIDPDPLLAAVESKETVTDLLSNMLCADRCHYTIVSGLSVIQTLLEFRKVSLDTTEQETQSEFDRQIVHSVLESVRPRLKDFHDVLQNPPSQHYSDMPCTVGPMSPPLGNTRLQITRLITSLIAVNSPHINEELANLATLPLLMDLYYTYSWNNFLHTLMQQCISTIFQLPPHEDTENTCRKHPLLATLIIDCKLIAKVIEAWEENEQSIKQGGHRKGYMGHLTNSANDLVDHMEKGDNSELIKECIKELPDETQELWDTFVAGPLTDTKKKKVPTATLR